MSTRENIRLIARTPFRTFTISEDRYSSDIFSTKKLETFFFLNSQ